MASPGERRSGWSRLVDADMIVAIAAFVIGISALVVSLVQVRIMRDEQHASVWPRLTVGYSYTQGERLGVIVANFGIGPAIIKSVTVSVDGRPRTEWTAALDALLREDRAYNTAISAISGRVVPAGEIVETFALRDSVLADRVEQEMDRLEVDVCYCSVYDRCWRVREPFGDVPAEPQEVATCPAVQAPRFED